MSFLLHCTGFLHFAFLRCQNPCLGDDQLYDKKKKKTNPSARTLRVMLMFRYISDGLQQILAGIADQVTFFFFLTCLLLFSAFRGHEIHSTKNIFHITDTNQTKYYTHIGVMLSKIC